MCDSTVMVSFRSSGYSGYEGERAACLIQMSVVQMVGPCFVYEQLDEQQFRTIRSVKIKPAARLFAVVLWLRTYDLCAL